MDRRTLVGQWLKRPAMPSDDALDTAIAWLGVNDAGGREQRACEAVAAYLEHLIAERTIEQNAKQAGVTTAMLRRAMRYQMKGPKK